MLLQMKANVLIGCTEDVEPGRHAKQSSCSVQLGGCAKVWSLHFERGDSVREGQQDSSQLRKT